MDISLSVLVRRPDRAAEWQDACDVGGRGELHHGAAESAKHRTAEWQAAAEALMIAAENRGPLMHAHIGMLRALNGAKRNR